MLSAVETDDLSQVVATRPSIASRLSAGWHNSTACGSAARATAARMNSRLTRRQKRINARKIFGTGLGRLLTADANRHAYDAQLFE